MSRLTLRLQSIKHLVVYSLLRNGWSMPVSLESRCLEDRFAELTAVDHGIIAIIQDLCSNAFVPPVFLIWYFPFAY